MTKESTNNPNAYFRETFNSYADVNKLLPAGFTSYTVADGIFTGVGGGSFELENTPTSTYSFRARIKCDAGTYFYDFRPLTDGAYCIINTTAINVSTGTIYIDGQVATKLPAYDQWVEIIISGVTTSLGQMHVFEKNTGSNSTTGSFELLEIYEGTLSAAEVKVMHENILYTEPAREVVGADQVTNGGFDTDTDWNKQTNNWSIRGGKARYTNGTSRYIAQPGVGTTEGNKYRLTFTISNNTNGRMGIYSSASAPIIGYVEYANGTHVVEYTGLATTGLYFFGNGSYSDFDLDNVVLEEITGEVLNVNANRGVIVDEQGNAIVNTGVTVVQDAQKVMSFDGGTSKLDCGNPTSLQITGSITLSAWVKFNGSGTQFIIAKDDNTNRNYGLYTSNGSIYMLIFISGAAKQAHTTATTFNDNRWHRIIGINNGTDLLVYVDGKLEPSTGGSGNGGVIDNDTVNLTIGVRANDTSDYLGLLGNVNINNRAWSAEEVARDFNSSKQRYNQ